jgi:hypothetical protein
MRSVERKLQIDFRKATAWERVMLVEVPWYYGSHNLHHGNLKEQFAENRGSMDSERRCRH